MANKKFNDNVIMAINQQGEFNGSTVKQIVNFIKSNADYSKTPKNILTAKVKKCVRHAELKGLLRGFHGRYRIDENNGKSKSFLRRHGVECTKRKHPTGQGTKRRKYQNTQQPCDGVSQHAKKKQNKHKAPKRKSCRAGGSTRNRRTRQPSPYGYVSSIEDLELAGRTLISMAEEMRATTERRRRTAAATNRTEGTPAAASRQNLLVQHGTARSSAQCLKPTPFPDSDNEYVDLDDEDDQRGLHFPEPFYKHGKCCDEQHPSNSHGLRDPTMQRVYNNAMLSKHSKPEDVRDDVKQILNSISVNDVITQASSKLYLNEEACDDDDVSMKSVSTSSEDILECSSEDSDDDSNMDDMENEALEEGEDENRDEERDYTSDGGKNGGDNVTDIESDDKSKERKDVDGSTEEIEKDDDETSSVVVLDEENDDKSRDKKDSPLITEETEKDDKGTIIVDVPDEEQPEPVPMPEQGEGENVPQESMAPNARKADRKKRSKSHRRY